MRPRSLREGICARRSSRDPVVGGGVGLGAALPGSGGLARGLALALVLFLVAAVLGNALICGGLSAPHPRYGARIIWLLPVAALLCWPRRRKA